MAVLDAQGLFRGDRLAACSDEARLYWPYYVAASNNFGRLELNPAQIVRTAFATCRQPPTAEQVTAHLREYRNNFLLFVYVAGGQAWGQWDIPEEHLKRHKTADDRRSPAPPDELLAAWKLEYQRRKAEDLGTLGDLIQNAPGYTQTRADAPTCAPMHTNAHECTEQVRGVGVGVGGGKGKGEALSRVTERDRHAWSHQKEKEKETTTTTTSQSSKKPRTKAQTISGYSETTARVVNEILQVWPRRQPKDGSPIRVDVALLASWVDEILRRLEVTPELLTATAAMYLAEPMNFFRAPQFFFGPGNGVESPWVAYARMVAHRARQEPIAESAVTQ